MKKCLLLLSLLFALACNGPRTDISIATYTWVGYAPLYLAQEKGFYDAEGIKVSLKKIDDTAARRAALQSGDVQASVNTVDAFSNVVAGGIKASVVLKMDDSLGGDGIVTNKDIASVTDLKDKDVAFPVGQPSHFFFYHLLKENGMTMDDIKTVPMEADQAGIAFMSKSVPAAVTWEPWLTNAKKSHGQVLASTRDVQVIVDVLTVRNDFLESHPDVIEAVAKAWMQAVEYWKQNPEEANKIMADAMGIPPEEFGLMLKGCSYADLAENQRYFRDNGSGKSDFHALMGSANDTWKSLGLIQKATDPKDADGSKIVMSLKK